MRVLSWLSASHWIWRSALPALVGAAGWALAGYTQEEARPPATHWWPEQTEQALVRAGTNRPQWEGALNSVPVGQRESLTFLLDNMPDQDLRTLTGKYLLENIALATDAFEKAPWAARSPILMPNGCRSVSAVTGH